MLDTSDRFKSSRQGQPGPGSYFSNSLVSARNGVSPAERSSLMPLPSQLLSNTASQQNLRTSAFNTTSITSKHQQNCDKSRIKPERDDMYSYVMAGGTLIRKGIDRVQASATAYSPNNVKEQKSFNIKYTQAFKRLSHRLSPRLQSPKTRLEYL